MSAPKQDLGVLLRQSAYLSERADEERIYLSRRAPNIIEWVAGTEYLSMPSIYRFWGAYFVLKEFFELRCPDCNVGPRAVPRCPWQWGRAETGLSRETLEAEVLLVWSERYQDDVCPKCGTTRAEFIDREVFNNYRVLHAIIGQRGGKSVLLAQIGTYIEHVLYAIGNGVEGGLSAYFQQPKGKPIDISYVASTATQAEDTIWAAYRGFRTNAPWFRRYVTWIKTQEKFQDTPKGMKPWSYSEGETFISNEYAGINIDSMNSSSNGIAGKTRVFAAIDELCRMKQTTGPQSAIEVYRSMRDSCRTIQGVVQTLGLQACFGMLGSISSPISVDDYGMQLLEDARFDKTMYTIHKATWDFNPELPFHMFAADLKKDYVGVMRNCGAKPPGAANPLVDRPDDFVASAVDLELKPTATFSYYKHLDKTGRQYAACKVEDADLILRGPPRFIAVDAGKNFDAFCVACAHGEYTEEGELVTVFDWCVRILTNANNEEVLFESLYNIIEKVQAHVVISRIEFDHWNSASLTQRIRDTWGLYTEEVCTTSEHFVQFMRDAYSGRVKMLPPLPEDATAEPPQKSAQATALYELQKLERDPKTDKVYNPRKGLRKGYDSDDMACVIVHAHRLVQEAGFVKKQDDTSKDARRKRGEAAHARWISENQGGLIPSKLRW